MIGLLFVIADVIVIGAAWRLIATRRINTASARVHATYAHPATQAVAAATGSQAVADPDVRREMDIPHEALEIGRASCRERV